MVDRLEDEYGIDITFVCFDPEPADSWEVRADGTPVFEVGHRRHRAGYSIFETTAETFESTIRNWLEEGE
ncbi:hypothetical protein [Saliphagus sp. LR7]|uniref:hypothetical protein n=1 Tax=Saliphagus sp. LR7 TaxID=2282654 RepID=UPI000DF7A68A|nr:hypothetical protein [Saliphagus sp. LR7]